MTVASSPSTLFQNLGDQAKPTRGAQLFLSIGARGTVRTLIERRFLKPVSAPMAVATLLTATAVTAGIVMTMNTLPAAVFLLIEMIALAALTRGLKDHAERIGQGKRAASISSDDVMVGAGALL